MNRVDLALFIFVACAAIRGSWRGFLRESFGFLGLVGGVAAAFRYGPVATEVLGRQMPSSAALEIQAGVGFVAIFVVVQLALNLLGLILDRMFGGAIVNVANRIAGGLLGASKGVALLAFLLLFGHLFSVSNFDAQIMASSSGRFLVNAAGNTIRSAAQSGAQPAS